MIGTSTPRVIGTTISPFREATIPRDLDLAIHDYTPPRSAIREGWRQRATATTGPPAANRKDHHRWDPPPNTWIEGRGDV